MSLAAGVERVDEFVVEGRLLTDVGGTIGASVLSTPGMISMMERCAGNALVTGAYVGQAIFGGVTYSTAGGSDVFLAKYGAADGAELWFKHFGGPSGDQGSGVAVDSSDNVVVTGQFQGSVDFGGGTYTSVNSDLFVAKYASSTGAYIWSSR